ncbi:hypothetical protein PINS_up001139 [Pythium insidiosum]|nr:hypothetical protein PINS_up001139 [Pythium insidiosum]
MASMPPPPPPPPPPPLSPPPPSSPLPPPPPPPLSPPPPPVIPLPPPRSPPFPPAIATVAASSPHAPSPPPPPFPPMPPLPSLDDLAGVSSQAVPTPPLPHQRLQRDGTSSSFSSPLPPCPEDPPAPPPPSCTPPQYQPLEEEDNTEGDDDPDQTSDLSEAQHSTESRLDGQHEQLRRRRSSTVASVLSTVNDDDASADADTEDMDADGPEDDVDDQLPTPPPPPSPSPPAPTQTSITPPPPPPPPIVSLHKQSRSSNSTEEIGTGDQLNDENLQSNSTSGSAAVPGTNGGSMSSASMIASMRTAASNREIMALDAVREAPPERSRWYIGDIDSYTIIDKVGSGTYGEVFKCQHKVTKDIVALKKLRSDVEKNGVSRCRRAPVTADEHRAHVTKDTLCCSFQ